MIDSLPEVRNVYARMGFKDNWQRGYNFWQTGSQGSYNFSAVGEETVGGSRNVVYHELAHAIAGVFAPAEWDSWKSIYGAAWSGGIAAKLTDCNREIYRTDEACTAEYWAELSRMFLGGERERIATGDPDAYSFLQSVYRGN